MADYRDWTPKDEIDAKYYIDRVEIGAKVAVTGARGMGILGLNNASQRAVGAREMKELLDKVTDLIKFLTD